MPVLADPRLKNAQLAGQGMSPMAANPVATYGAPAAAAPAQDGADAAGGTGFLNLGRLLGVNADRAATSANELGSDIEAKGKDVKDRTQEGYSSVLAGGGTIEDYQKGLGDEATDVSGKASMLGSESGRTELEKEKHGKEGGYGAGAAGFDALLAGSGGGGQQLDTVSSAYKGLADQLGVANTKAVAVHQHLADQDAKNRDAVAKQTAETQRAATEQQAKDAAAVLPVANMAANDDPDRGWFSDPDPIWKSITKAEAGQIQNAHDTMSPSAYRDWLVTFKRTRKAQGAVK